MKVMQIAFEGSDIEYAVLERMYQKRDREIRLARKKPGTKKRK